MTERKLRRPGKGGWLLLFCAIAWMSGLSLAMASEYHGQVTFGGLPLPGSTVTVTATQGEKTAVAITDTQGFYSFADLADGKWTIAIEMTGFAPVKQEVTVAPNAAAGAFEMKLLTLEQMRAAAKPVKEEAAPSRLGASAATAAESTNPAAPGSQSAPTANPAVAAGTGAAAANTAAAAAAKKKGAAAKTEEANAAAAAPPMPAPEPDATAQQANDGLLINGSVNNAATSQYSMSQAFGNTRSGGRSLYNYGLSLVLNNSALNAKPYSLTGLDTPVPSNNKITAGVSFGGPLNIKHLMPRGPYLNLLYSRTQNSTITAQPALVPTAAERAGNFSGLAIFNPATGTQYTGNVPISAQAQALLNLYPLPSPSLAGNAQYNYQVPLNSDSHQDAIQAMMSKMIGNKNYLYGGFNFTSARSSNTNLFGFEDSTGVLNLSVNASWYHRFTQRVWMTANYTFSRSRTQVTPYFANRENVEGNAQIANGANATPANWGPPGLGFASGIAGLSDATSSYNRPETNSLSYNVEWYHQRHDIKMGGDFRRQESNIRSQANPEGSLSFTGTATQSSTGAGGSDFADFLLGIPDTSSIAYGNADKYLRQSVYDLYARDDFRVNSEFSVNWGIRWEYGAPVTELKGRLVNLDVGPGFTAEQAVLGSSPVGRADRTELSDVAGPPGQDRSCAECGDCVAANLGVVVADPVRLSDQPRHIGVSGVGDGDGAAGAAVDEFERLQQRGVPVHDGEPVCRSSLFHHDAGHVCRGPEPARGLCADLEPVCAARPAGFAADGGELSGQQGDAGRAGVSAEHGPGRGNGPVRRVSFGLSVSHVQWKLDARGGEHRAAAAVAQRAASGCDVHFFEVAG